MQIFYFEKTRKILTILLLFSLLVPSVVAAQSGSRFSIVPCDTSDNLEQCKFSDIIKLIVRVINFMLAASVIVAIYYIFLSAWGMMTALGNPEKTSNAKEGLTRALIGFSIVLLSFALVNLLVAGIFGVECEWWKDPFCVATPPK